MDRFVYKQKRKNVILLHVQRARRNHQKEHTHNTLEDLDRTWAGIRKKKRNTRSKIFALSAETPWQVENEQVASMRRAWNAVIKLISDISTTEEWRHYRPAKNYMSATNRSPTQVSLIHNRSSPVPRSSRPDMNYPRTQAQRKQPPYK